MAVSGNWGSFKTSLRFLQGGLVLLQGRFRADPYKDYRTASVNWRPFWWLSFS